MIFQSVPFAVFFSVFFALYWIFGKKSLILQNSLLLIGSSVFYAWADWRFLVLLVCISVFVFFLGILIYQTENERKRRFLIYFGLIQGVGGLFLFKYFNFFVESFNSALEGFSFNLQTLNILIPLGISYYTFKTISYLLDIDKGKIKPSKDFIVFFNYLSFFPTLLSGPIDSGRSFIPQLEKKHVFNISQASDGVQQVLWGLFKKLVIADNLAIITNPIFDQHANMPASSLIIGAILYPIQIYADFSGYSDMAIGFGRLLGFKVTKNFNFPLFAQNIADFWRKWHISLTAWLTEYVFTPLVIYFRDYGRLGVIIAIVVNFTICGLWHGANWTFALFGLIHGLFFIPLILKGKMNKKKKTSKSFIPGFRELINMISTYLMVIFTFIIFRSSDIQSAVQYYKGMFSKSELAITGFEYKIMHGEAFVIVFLLIFVFSLEWLGRSNEYAIEGFRNKFPKSLRYLFYIFLIFLIGMFAPTSETPFIYLKF